MKNLKRLIGIFFLALLSFTLEAQPGNPDVPDDPVPLTGIEVLLLAGGALGGYKMLKGKKASSDPRE